MFKNTKLFTLRSRAEEGLLGNCGVGCPQICEILVKQTKIDFSIWPLMIVITLFLHHSSHQPKLLLPSARKHTRALRPSITLLFVLYCMCFLISEMVVLFDWWLSMLFIRVAIAIHNRAHTWMWRITYQVCCVPIMCAVEATTSNTSYTFI